MQYNPSFILIRQIIALCQMYFRTYFQQRYEEVSTTLFASNPDTFLPSVFTYDAFVWAVCAVRSRVHPPLDADNIALVPFADTVGFFQLYILTMLPAWEGFIHIYHHKAANPM
jgi:hypothetical protein